MKPQEWRQKLGDCVRRSVSFAGDATFLLDRDDDGAGADLFVAVGDLRPPEKKFWPQVAANCPEFEVKQRIMEHEHEELVEDEHSKAGHLDLILGRAKNWDSASIMFSRPRPCRRQRLRFMAGFGSRAIGRGRKPLRLRALRNGPMMIGCWATWVAAIAPGCTRSGSGISTS